MTEGPQQPNQPRPGGYGYPNVGGYGYPQGSPQQPSGSAWTPPSDGLGHGSTRQPRGGQNQPDWSALAERTESASRRRKLYMIGGGVLATAVIAGIVATAVISSDNHNKQAASGGSTGGQNAAGAPPQPTPTFSDVTPPPPPNPLAVLSNPKKDTAPLTPTGLFFGTQLTINGRQYTRATTDSATGCSGVAAGGLAGVLDSNGCDKVLRATYTRNGIAVTVGVAVFNSKSSADNAKAQYTGYVQPLAGGGVPSFCHATACSTSANSVGRYAYFTIAGFTNGSAVTSSDTQAPQAGTDIADFAFQRIVQRGENEAGG
ncbi:hypothetical protein NGB36_12490 [Streptomyces sp. RB6PN25]|uniref:Tat pathway signal sequence domain protein n=1 Tax=Streptomyces humicola TaxID=2953240 RepID=A0ABT1PUP2_9ACTN|nr:hypothetical protein [Streptomyces humicola]MCQ4081394.1 hypothetical protein [Streptomyces humicola]